MPTHDEFLLPILELPGSLASQEQTGALRQACEDYGQARSRYEICQRQFMQAKDLFSQDPRFEPGCGEVFLIARDAVYMAAKKFQVVRRSLSEWTRNHPGAAQDAALTALMASVSSGGDSFKNAIGQMEAALARVQEEHLIPLSPLQSPARGTQSIAGERKVHFAPQTGLWRLRRFNKNSFERDSSAQWGKFVEAATPSFAKREVPRFDKDGFERRSSEQWGRLQEIVRQHTVLPARDHPNPSPSPSTPDSASVYYTAPSTPYSNSSTGSPHSASSPASPQQRQEGRRPRSQSAPEVASNQLSPPQRPGSPQRAPEPTPTRQRAHSLGKP